MLLTAGVEDANLPTLTTGFGVVTESWILGATGRTRPVRRNLWLLHGLRTTRGTRVDLV